ncbi:nitronate monooxygenase [Legionella gresilensis]|uniref:nitronate monooxygenase n=1 Tax=Legionella gresilensis TaxID=91823 RepID=UPI0013EF7A81|nr:nitronate monooxygenase [Legionella gresilensis]
MKKSNLLTSIPYPIIQAPMAGGIVSPELTAMVSNAGMLGSIASGYLSLEDCEKLILAVKSLTFQPYIVNVFIEEPRCKEQVLPKPKTILALEKKAGLVPKKTFIIPKTINQQSFAQLFVKHQVPIVSTTFGIFDADIIKYLKEHEVKLLVNCCSCAEAQYAAEQGADALILQGTEAGGHQGSFLTNEPNELTTLDLLKQVKKLELSLPLIAAGGINLDNIKTYWQAGAALVQLGTLFMLSNLSLLSKKCIQYLLSDQPPIKTKLTDAITGKWVRSIENTLATSLKKADYLFPVQHYATTYLRSMCRKKSFFDFTGLWLGKHENYQFLIIEDLINRLRAAYEKECERIKQESKNIK